MNVVITGAPAERELVQRIAHLSQRHPATYIGANGLPELIALLASFDGFVASSTGPLHIASATGTPVVGLYSPIFVNLPDRWGPIGDRDQAIAPDVPPCDRCVKQECLHYDCMASITVDAVVAALYNVMGHHLLPQSASPPVLLPTKDHR
jgi:ADP-heptose:LPS heptosyltransferase